MFHLILNTKSYLKESRTKNTWVHEQILCNGHFAFRLYSACSLSTNTWGRFIIFVSFHLCVFSLANSELNAFMTSWWEKASLPFLMRAKFSFTNRAKRLGVRVWGVPSFFNWGTSSKKLEKREGNENSQRNNAKRQKKRLSRGLRKCIRIREEESSSYTCFTTILSNGRPVCSCIKVIFKRQKRHLVTKTVVPLSSI